MYIHRNHYPLEQELYDLLLYVQRAFPRLPAYYQLVEGQVYHLQLYEDNVEYLEA